MTIQTFATGSTGNCHLVTVNNVNILLDCGIGFKKLQTLMKGKLPRLVLVTHEHADHANVATLNQLLERSVEVAMTQGTADALNLNHFNLSPIYEQRFMSIGDVASLKAIDVSHDAVDPVNFIISDKDDTLLYLTDCGEVPPLRWNNYHINKLLIEANYLPERLLNSAIDENQRRRIQITHLSIDQTLEFIKSQAKNLDEVYICHVSKRHGNCAVFKELVQMTVPRLKVTVCENQSVGR